MLISYELQVLRGGAWQINAIFDDQDLAVSEARRLANARRYPGVRVIREVFNPDTDRTETRTVFRYSSVQEENDKANERLNPPKREYRQQQRDQREGRVAKSPRRAQDKTRSAARWWTMMGLRIAGLAALIGLFLHLRTLV